MRSRGEMGWSFTGWRQRKSRGGRGVSMEVGFVNAEEISEGHGEVSQGLNAEIGKVDSLAFWKGISCANFIPWRGEVGSHFGVAVGWVSTAKLNGPG